MDNFQEDDNIRPPDEVVRETLIEDTRSDFEKQMDEAMYLSMQEMKQQREINEQYEEQLLKNYADETKRRINLFKNFMANMTKLCRFDNEVREIYNILDPIIESYCDLYFETCELDGGTYDKIFDTLKKIRNDQQALDTLKTIILRE
jgi:hypothetical protein